MTPNLHTLDAEDANSGAHSQFNNQGNLQHLLTLEGLPKETLIHILDTAEQFVSVTSLQREVKKVPLLRGKSVFNLFYENSTRTRTTFEIAAKRLSADVINLYIQTSSTKTIVAPSTSKGKVVDINSALWIALTPLS